jgi:hypothetical protein
MMGTEKTPVELRPRFSYGTGQNFELACKQLRDAKVSEADIAEFSFTYGQGDRRANVDPAQFVHPILHAAAKIGVTVHWVN